MLRHPRRDRHQHRHAGGLVVRIDGQLTDFVVNLFGLNSDGSDAATTFVRVPFSRLAFRAGTGVSETVEPELGTVTFHGPLQFLDDLARYIALVPGAGGGGLTGAAGAQAEPGQTRNGPYVDVTDSGVEAGIGVALPEIGTGVLTLSNLSLLVALRLPFDGSRVTLRFAFSSREDPFSLTVWGIGGGGFAGITLSIDGVETLEVALEFGAAIGISLGGVISGKVEIKAGIYFKVETTDAGQECVLQAYIGLRGAVDVLGLIEVSITFELSLSYITSTCSLAGEGTLKIEIDLTVWSTTVEVSVRKEISSGGCSAPLSGLQAHGPSEAVGAAGLRPPPRPTTPSPSRAPESPGRTC